jgi:hypothetical protein
MGISSYHEFTLNIDLIFDEYKQPCINIQLMAAFFLICWTRSVFYHGMTQVSIVIQKETSYLSKLNLHHGSSFQDDNSSIHQNLTNCIFIIILSAL